MILQQQQKLSDVIFWEQNLGNIIPNYWGKIGE